MRRVVIDRYPPQHTHAHTHRATQGVAKLRELRGEADDGSSDGEGDGDWQVAESVADYGTGTGREDHVSEP